MTADLSAYAGLSRRVAGLGPEGEIGFDPGCFPDGLHERQDFGELVIDSGLKRSIAWLGEGPDLPFEILDQVHSTDWYAEPEGWRRIGLWLMHLLLSGRDWAGLTLTHAESRIAEIYVALDRPRPASSFVDWAAPVQVAHVIHMPRPVARHAFADPPKADPPRIDDLRDRPMIRHGWRDQAARHRGRAEEADQVILSLTLEGTVALAELWLDFAAPGEARDEINIESPLAGFGATQPGSIEARFWKPGSFAFYCDRLDDLRLPDRA
ncbi:hypothetical protein [Roseicyclus mahoneyensis]|uniref:Uncharacterized protein n=1 Tax=Roseicyclus mahoneyensis TaxID=164332 RepID=A0A316GFM2_9RHOB|nr:hypothetical protein [Roseicyclus mahoneyensis]PWK59725.1 hypothetical protein C7455_10610 [Roseicyclus mahoneyensis]